ncbi:MAG: hypothetical protein Q7R95_06780 [bacterium]|nr:hypothetical protein [bacterium]
MVNNENEKRIFDSIPNNIKQTTITKLVGNITIVRVDPERVVKLIQTLQEKGLTQIRYKNGARKLDFELARKYAQTANDILGYTIGQLNHLQIPIISASNWGSTVTGFVAPESDVEVLFDLVNVQDLHTAGQALRHDRTFQNNLWNRQTPIKIPSVTFSLAVPSIYEQQPGEKWIPSANDTITLKRPWLK